MKKIFCLLLIIAALGVKAQQIFSISGTVSDEKGTTLPGATVFITNSKFIQPTDGDGNFKLSGLRPGAYQLVVKMLGSEPFIQSITLKEESVTVKVVLKESNTTLNAVTINGGKPDPDREKYLAWFIKDFIGETINSLQCKLLNPEAVHFHFDKIKNTLTATAEDFLVVENKALGYKLKYLLHDFEIDFNAHSGYYSGYPYFEDLPGSESQKKRWEASRKVAYLSSARHFFKAVMNNTAEKEGFIVCLVLHNPAEEKDVWIQVAHIDSLFGSNGPSFKTLKAPKQVINGDESGRPQFVIVYTKQDEPPLFSLKGNPIQVLIKIPSFRQVSSITPLTDEITIDNNGILSPDRGYKNSGYWAWLRIGDLPPLDYFGE